MNLTRVIFLAGSLGAILCAADHQDTVRLLSTAPVRFEPADAAGSGRYVARGLHFRYEFDKNRASLHAGKTTAGLQFVGANADATLQGVDVLASKTTSFKGNDKSKWRGDIPNYARLKAVNLYNGIDLIYYGTSNELEYDLNVKPGADPRQIRLVFEGASMIQKDPVAYQIAADGTKVAVAGSYHKNRDGSLGFALGSYDHNRELVIDPVLTLSLYLSGSSNDTGTAIGHDNNGLLYIGGTTSSTDFPLDGSSYQSTTGGEDDAFIAVLNPAASVGSQVVYTTYFGGSGDEELTDMVVTGNGVVFATGTTNSDNLPTANPYSSTLGGLTDAFILKLIPSQGTSGLYYASYLGGADADTPSGITVDSAGKIYVVGTTQSDDFPFLNGFETSLAGTQDAFLSVIDPSQSLTATLTYSTFIGGTSENSGEGVALAPDGTVWVVGGTFSSDFPIYGYCYRYSYIPGGDAFAVHLNPSAGANSLLYGSFLGGSGQDEAKKVLVDSKGRLIITGYTLSIDLPVTSNALQSQYGGNTDVFVAILDPSIQSANRSDQLVYSTYYGGSFGEVPYSLKEDSAGNLYITGFTMSPDFPLTSNTLDSTYDDSLDAFILIFNPTTPAKSGPILSTFLASGGGVQVANGIDFDSKGNVYVVGYTTGSIFQQLGGVPNSKGDGLSAAFVLGFKVTGLAAQAKSHRGL